MTDVHSGNVHVMPDCFSYESARVVADNLVTRLASMFQMTEGTRSRTYEHCCETIVGEEICEDSVVFAWIAICMFVVASYDHDLLEAQRALPPFP